ncbi:MAG: murein biosynthesis integral membrane protein MurJ [Planctomycetota bacterium]|nr:MAG: murein biosynthesis integral membrane protein MurJ [Planctomycetota bacterium]
MSAPARFVSSTRLISALTLTSRVLGLAREAVFGYFFGASGVLSAFRIAFMLPNLARRLFGEGALSAALIPVLTRVVERDGTPAARRFVGTVFAWVALVLAGIVAVLEIGILLWRSMADDAALRYAAVLLPYMPLICCVALLGGALQVRGRFGTPAACPILLNVSIIVSALVAGGAGWRDERLMAAICAGVLAAGVLQLATVWTAAKRAGVAPLVRTLRLSGPVRDVLTMMGPMVLGLSAVQINSLLDYLIAYGFVQVRGERIGPAVLGFAQYLYQLPLGVFGIALATAVFPDLSRHAARREEHALNETLQRAVRLSLFIALPASAGLILVAQPLVATLYQRGAFDAAQTARVAGVLRWYGVGMAAYFLQHILVRAFYAVEDSTTPARVAARMVLVNVTLNLLLVQVMEERGLALSTSACAFLQILLLARTLRRRLPKLDVRPLRRPIVLLVSATVVMGGAVYALRAWLEHGFREPPPTGLQLAILVAAGMGIYGVVASVLRLPELHWLLKR